MTPLERAIEAAGGASSLAAAIGVSSNLPSMWKARGNIPAEYCPAIERATSGAVRCEDLRPDVAWDVVRGSTVITKAPRQARQRAFGRKAAA